MARYINRKPIEVNVASPQQNHIPIYDGETRLWATANIFEIISTQTGSVVIGGDLTVSGSLSVLGGITGSLAGTASYADNAGLLDNTGSATFATTGSNTFFGTQTIFGDIFAESDTLIVTGSINLQGDMNVSEGIIVLAPIEAPTAVTGGVLYSSSGEFFVGMNS
jgi:hypothetical protein